MTDNSAVSLTRAVEVRNEPSITDMNPSASFGPQSSTTLSPMHPAGRLETAGPPRTALRDRGRARRFVMPLKATRMSECG